MEEIANALELKNELDTLRPIDKEKEAIIMQKFRLDWNYHSNHLEGNTLTYGETKALILFGITAQGKSLKDTLEITGHNEAINWVIDLVKMERPLTENFIRELHSLLLQDSYKESKNADGLLVPRKISAGKYKTTTNHVETVTGEIFYFASPEETPAKMFDLLNWYNQKTKEENVNPILIAAEFHYRFIRIHPFDDGNGRTARILMNFILMQFGFPPAIIKTEDKANYFAALQMADAGNIEAFVNYIAKNLVHSLEIMIAGAKGESIEEDDDLDKEIALIEQRLKNVDEFRGKKERLQKKEKFFKNSILPLINIFIERISKFNKIYEENYLTLEIGTKTFRNKSDFEEYLEKALINFEELEEVNVEIIFGSLKKNFEGNIGYMSQLLIEFKEETCSISRDIDEICLSSEYKNKLTALQIDEIVNYEIKSHKEFIEQKIAEKENK